MRENGRSLHEHCDRPKGSIVGPWPHPTPFLALGHRGRSSIGCNQMTWQPITETQLWDEINRGVANMTIEQCRLWDAIHVLPLKWSLSPWGDHGGGFWIVAIVGQTVVWYNDIEDGFNRSTYSQFGVINDYRCNQDELNWTVRCLFDEIQSGRLSGYNAGPPQSIDEPSDAPKSPVGREFKS
jgi:hypothetical protein